MLKRKKLHCKSRNLL